MRALLGVSYLLAPTDNDPAMSAASVARMSEAISGGSLAKVFRISLHSCGLLALDE